MWIRPGYATLRSHSELNVFGFWSIDWQIGIARLWVKAIT
jgi:hypothetical protein